MSTSEPSDFSSKLKKLFTEPMSVFRGHDSTNVYSISIDLIEPKLYLGSRFAATDIKTLEKYKITHILTIDDAPLHSKIGSLKKVKYIQLSDLPREDLLSCLEQANEFINEGIAKGVILVHCFHGISRSASLVIAHIMKKYDMTYSQAFEKVQQKRNRIFPNHGFSSQLHLYREMGYKLDPTNEKFKYFRLKVAANKIRQQKSLPNEFMHLIQPDPCLDQLESTVPQTHTYNCKKCQRILARGSNLIIHKFKGKVCEVNYFFEPLAWMDVAKHKQNELFCPQCKAEVGSFSWVEYYKCSCDVIVSPAFWLTPTKVAITEPKI